MMLLSLEHVSGARQGEIDTLVSLPATIGSGPGVHWIHLRADLIIQDDVVTLHRANVFAAANDRPVLFSALAWADTLLTLDRAALLLFAAMRGSS
jgi:hypothetical protein